MINNNTSLIKSPIYENPFAKSSIDYTSAKILDYIQLEKSLDTALKKIKGQDAAVNMIKQSLLTLSTTNPERPHTLFFAGPPGCGKSECANIIADTMGCGKYLIDASSCQDPQIFGPEISSIPDSFRDSDVSPFSKFLLAHPYGVIIIEEPDKSHAQFMNLFLNIINSGLHYDKFLARNINCKNNTFIFCSNCCSDIWNSPNSYSMANIPMESIISSLRRENNIKGQRVFSDAFISRIAGNTVLFNVLHTQVVRSIISNEIKKERDNIYDVNRLKLSLDTTQFAESLILESGESDLRVLTKLVQRRLSTIEHRCIHLSRAMSKNKDRFIERIKVDFDLSDANKEALDLLKNGEKRRVLISSMDREKYFHYIPENVELMEVDNVDIDVRNVKFLDISLAILNAKDSNTRHVFDAVIAQSGRIPTYVYSEETDSSILYYYVDHGAVATTNTDINAFIHDILKGVDFTNAVATARKLRRIINWDCDYQYDKTNYEVIVRYHNARCDTAKDATDESEFVTKTDIPTVSFDDIIGCDTAKNELRRAARYLSDPKKYQRMGLKSPKAILLYGDPGTGKTLLAKATAAHCGLQYIEKNATEFLHKHVGEGARIIRETFRKARKYGALIFIDEIDVISRSRMSGYGDDHHTNDLVNCLLSELEAENEGVLVICATNFGVEKGDTKLDEALLRRFDHKISVTLPQYSERVKFIEMKLSKTANSVSDNCITSIAKRAVAWSLSDLCKVIESAQRKYADFNEAVGLDDATLLSSFESFHDGEEKHQNEIAMQHTAYHEAGHAVVASALGNSVINSSIVSRQNYDGYIQLGENENQTTYSKQDLLDKICISLSGRASEVMIYGEDGITTGASSDLKTSKRTAKRMLTEFGMDENDPFLFIDQQGNQDFLEQKTQKLMLEQYKRAKEMVIKYRKAIEAVAQELLIKNTLNEEELKAIIDKYC